MQNLVKKKGFSTLLVFDVKHKTFHRVKTMGCPKSQKSLIKKLHFLIPKEKVKMYDNRFFLKTFLSLQNRDSTITKPLSTIASA